MTEARGGFLIKFDEEQRAPLLQQAIDVRSGFSDALSTADWPLGRWEVCGLMFAPDTITHWALARRNRRVATAKSRVEFIQVAATDINLQLLENLIEPRLQRFIVRARSGAGGRVPPATWSQLKDALKRVDPDSYELLDRLERRRDSSDSTVDHPAAHIVAQERDATGIVLDIFDSTHQLRKDVLTRWTPPAARQMRSFLDGLDGVRTIEDHFIAHDASGFPEATRKESTIVGTVFQLGNRMVEVMNVNRTGIENALGVDLIYYNEQFGAWTMLQYKALEGHAPAGFRPNAQFDAELRRMLRFRRKHRDRWKQRDDLTGYRLCGDGFYFKFCSRIQLEILSPGLLPGMYLPRPYLQALLRSQGTGSRGGRFLTEENAGRHISNTLFATLVRDAWIGTRGLSSRKIAQLVSLSLDAGRSVVIGRGRAEGKASDLDETRSLLDL